MGDSVTGNQKVLSTLLRFQIKLDVQDTVRALSSLRGRDEDGAIIVAADEATALDDELEEQEFFFQSDLGTRWRGQQRRSLAAVDFYTLTDVVTANFNGCFEDAFSKMEGTAPFDRVVLDYDGRRLRFLRSLREVTAGFTGVAIFTKQEGLQVPDTNTVASVQLGCMQVVGTTLLTDIQEADPSAGLGSNVVAVSASVISNEPSEPGTNEAPPNSGNGNNNSDDGGLDAVIVVAMVIAILATILLAVALIIAWRRKKRAESAYMIGRKSSKVKKSLKTNLSPLGRRGNSSQNPSDTPTTERSAGNHSGKEPPLPGEEQEESESELEISQMPTGLYPESVISDDINSSLQAYEKGGGKGQTPPPSSGGKARQHPATQGGRREMDNQSVSSMESYGYSLDGYASSLAPSTQYGY